MKTLLALLVCFTGLATASPGDTTRYDTLAYGRDTCRAGQTCRYTTIKIHPGSGGGSGAFADSSRASHIADTVTHLNMYTRDTVKLRVGPTRKYTTIDAAIAYGASRGTALIVDIDPAGTYSSAGGNFPAIPIVVFGNGSTVTLTNPARLNASWRAYDMSIIGNVCFNGSSTDRYYLTGGVTTGTDTLNAGYLHYDERTISGGVIVQNGGTLKIIGTTVTSTILHNAGSLQINNSNVTGSSSGALITSVASGATDAFRILGGWYTNSGTGTTLDLSGNSVSTANANSLANASFKTGTAASVIGGAAVIEVTSCDASITPTGTGYIGTNWTGVGGAYNVPGMISNKLYSIAVFGQSNEAGAATHWVAGTAGTTKTNAQYRSRHGKYSDPMSPRVQPTIYLVGADSATATVYQNPMVAGAWWGQLGDMLYEHGYDVNFFNTAAGSLSFVGHVNGTLKAWGAKKAFSSYIAPLGGDNLGFKGDFILVGTKVFQCIRGGNYGIAFYHNPGVFRVTENNAWRDEIDDLFWPPPVSGGGKTAAVAPNWAAAVTVGDTLNDSTLTWKLVKTNETTFAAYPAANCVVNSAHPAFDPLGMLARTKTVLDAEPSNRTKWVFVQNGQSDLGTSDVYLTWYMTALTNIATYFHTQGYKVAIGATCGNPKLADSTWTGALGPKHPSAMISIAADSVVKTLNSSTNYIKGGDLWKAWGVGPQLKTAPDDGSTTPGVHLTDVMMWPSAVVWYKALMQSTLWQ